MRLSFLGNVAYCTEVILWCILFALSRRRRPTCHLHAVRNFLGFRAVSEVLLLAFYESHRLVERTTGLSPDTTYMWFFYSSWVVEFIGAALIFLMLQDLFRYALTPLPGLSQLGILAFRWAAVVSVLISTFILFSPTSIISIPSPMAVMGTTLMRCEGVIEFCLLAFFVMTLHKLGLSFRTRAFGISLSLGIMATAEAVASAILVKRPYLLRTMNSIEEYVFVFALGIWMSYMLLPEPARRPVAMPSTSPLAKWNEIAKALGHGPAYISVSQPANASFLQGVEEVVQRVKARNALDNAS